MIESYHEKKGYLKLFTDPDGRRYFLNLAVQTRCATLLQYVFNNTKDAKSDTDYKESTEIKNENDNQVILELAIKNGFKEGIFTLLQQDNWNKIFRRQSSFNDDPNSKSPMQLLIEYMPEIAKVLFDKCIRNVQDETVFNYELINDERLQVMSKKNSLNVSYSKSKETITSTACSVSTEPEKVSDVENQELHFCETIATHPLTLMIEHKRYSLLNHPLVISYIDLKWNRFAKWGYYSLCLFYLFIAFGLTALTVIIKPSTAKNGTEEFMSKRTQMEDGNGGDIGPSNIISGIIITFIFFLQLGLLLARYKLYKTFDLKHHWFDIFALILTVFASMPICLFTPFETHWYIIVILNFCAWITLLNYIKRHPRFGVYVVMITYVFKSFLQFAPIFIMVLLPFVVLFYVLLGEGIGVFAFFDTFIHTLVMMIGEFDYKDSVASKESFVTSAMFCLFLFAVTIFLMNLLTGLAVSDTTKILQEAVVGRRIKQIETIHHFESIKWIRKKYWDGYCKKSKRMKEIEKETHRLTSPGFRKLFKWWGMSKDAARRIDNCNPTEDKLAALEEKLDQSINNLNEKMNDIIELLKRR